MYVTLVCTQLSKHDIAVVRDYPLDKECLPPLCDWSNNLGRSGSGEVVELCY